MGQVKGFERLLVEVSSQYGLKAPIYPKKSHHSSDDHTPEKTLYDIEQAISATQEWFNTHLLDHIAHQSNSIDALKQDLKTLEQQLHNMELRIRRVGQEEHDLRTRE